VIPVLVVIQAMGELRRIRDCFRGRYQRSDPSAEAVAFVVCGGGRKILSSDLWG